MEQTLNKFKKREWNGKIESMQSLQQNVLSLTQTISNTFLMVGHMMNQITPRYPVKAATGGVL